MNHITTIGFDADDTLWHNERYFRFTEERFASMLGDHAPREVLAEKLLAAERKNLKFYGFGIKGFTLSMIETAIEVTDRKVSAKVIADILEAGREMLHHPVELLPQAQTILAKLSPDYKLVLVTKGDLFDQERKLAQSGLGDYFHGVEIVSDKTADTYVQVFQRHGTGPEHAVMVGNSLKSDVVPAIGAGAVGVHVPHDLTWVHEHDEAPKDHPRYHEIAHLGELPGLITQF